MLLFCSTSGWRLRQPHGSGYILKETSGENHHLSLQITSSPANRCIFEGQTESHSFF